MMNNFKLFFNYRKNFNTQFTSKIKFFSNKEIFSNSILKKPLTNADELKSKSKINLIKENKNTADDKPIILMKKINIRNENQAGIIKKLEIEKDDNKIVLLNRIINKKEPIKLEVNKEEEKINIFKVKNSESKEAERKEVEKKGIKLQEVTNTIRNSNNNQNQFFEYLKRNNNSNNDPNINGDTNGIITKSNALKEEFKNTFYKNKENFQIPENSNRIGETRGLLNYQNVILNKINENLNRFDNKSTEYIEMKKLLLGNRDIKKIDKKYLKEINYIPIPIPAIDILPQIKVNNFRSDKFYEDSSNKQYIINHQQQQQQIVINNDCILDKSINNLNQNLSEKQNGMKYHFTPQNEKNKLTKKVENEIFKETNKKFILSAEKVNELYLDDDNILNDKKLIKFLFDLENSEEFDKIYQQLMSNEEKNANDILLFVKYFLEKNMKFLEYLEWLVYNLEKFSADYLLMLLNHIVETKDFRKIDPNTMIRLNFIYLKFKYRNINLLQKLEIYFVDNYNDLSSNFYTSLLSSLKESHFKTNDDLLGKFLSNFFNSYIQKANFNSLVIPLGILPDFKYIDESTWKLYEYEVLNKLKHLYKAKSIERIVEGFTSYYKNYNKKVSSGILNILRDFIINNAADKIHLVNFSRATLKMIGVGILLPESVIKQSETRTFRRKFKTLCTQLIFNIEEKYYLSIYNKEKNDEMTYYSCVNSFRNISNQLNGSEINEILHLIKQFNLFKYFKFKKEDFETLKRIECYYYELYELLHCFAKNDERIQNLFDYLVKAEQQNRNYSLVNCDDLHVSISKYLYTYKNENISNLFYKYMVNYFKTTYYSKYFLEDKYKLWILTYPLFKFVIQKNSTIFNSTISINSKYYLKEIIYNNLDIESSDDLVAACIIKNENLISETNPNLTSKIIHIDLHNQNSSILRKIKEYGNFSTTEMEQIYSYGNYKFKFYSSLYSNNNWHF